MGSSRDVDGIGISEKSLHGGWAAAKVNKPGNNDNENILLTETQGDEGKKV